MEIKRFSAADIFGIPMENPESVRTRAGVLALLGAYDIQGQDVPADVIDITPYYWQKHKFNYLMTRQHEDGPAQVEFMPTSANSETYTLAGRMFVQATVRNIIIPTNQEMFIILGPGPRFGDQVCIHEAIVSVG